MAEGSVSAASNSPRAGRARQRPWPAPGSLSDLRFLSGPLKAKPPKTKTPPPSPFSAQASLVPPETIGPFFYKGLDCCPYRPLNLEMGSDEERNSCRFGVVLESGACGGSCLVSQLKRHCPAFPLCPQRMDPKPGQILGLLDSLTLDLNKSASQPHRRPLSARLIRGSNCAES